MIFIQIASYRDPQLTKTIDDCIAKAKHPDQLRFGVCWQFGDDEDLNDYFRSTGIRYIPVPIKDTLGACWARSMVNQLYNNEKYTLMIDSHMRFAQDWDETLIDMLESLPYKSVITTYAPAFNIETEEKTDNPWIMNVDRRYPIDLPLFIPSHSDHTEPLLTYCFSAHFAFTRGEFVNEVPYDPELYFHGEEVTMAMRAFTHGYNLYHPHKVVIWHEYTRANRVKHWDDDPLWWQLDQRAKERAIKVLNGEIPDQIGTARNSIEYKKLLGI